VSSDDELIVAGVILRGFASKIERIIDVIEREPGVELVYARRAPFDAFLLLVQTKREVRREVRNAHTMR
jgi:hypothetical protein